MKTINFPTEEEIRQAYHQGEEAVVALFYEMIGNNPDGKCAKDRRPLGQE
jgi:hypothetical protein